MLYIFLPIPGNSFGILFPPTILFPVYPCPGKSPHFSTQRCPFPLSGIMGTKEAWSNNRTAFTVKHHPSLPFQASFCPG